MPASSMQCGARCKARAQLRLGGADSSPRQTPEDEPTSISRDASEQPEQTEPPKEKRKLRKFAIRRKCRLPPLPQDAWDNLLGHLCKKPLSLLLCMMTCKELRDLIREHHQTWRAVYSRWEGRYASNNSGSVCYVRPVPNALGYMRLGMVPRGKPVTGQPNVANFANYPILECERPNFHAFVRKLVAMYHLDRCSLCGTRRRTSKPYWSLGLFLCKPCLRHNLISHRVLALKFGLGLQDQYEGTEVMQLFRRRVFYFRTISAPDDRMDYTVDPLDFETRNSEEIYFFWRPHIEKIIDLAAILQRKRDRAAAATVLSAWIRAKRVRQIQQYVDGKPRLDRDARLKRLYKGEIARFQAEHIRGSHRPMLAEIFRTMTWTDRQRLLEGSDSLPEPWDTELEPTDTLDNRPQDPLLEN